MTSLWMPVLIACAMLMTSVESRSLRQTHILQQLLKQLRNAGGTGDAPDFTHDLTHETARPDFTDLVKQAKGHDGKKALEYDESRTRQSFFQRMQKNADDETELQINMCYFCDSRCAHDIDTRYPSTNAYFAELSSVMETDLNSMENLTFHIHTHIVLAANQVIQGSWYMNTAADTDTDMLASVNNNFWLAHNMWQTGLSYGCDAGFLVITESDHIWNNNYCGQLHGVANMFQICNSLSFATVRLELNMHSMSTLCAHELGHLCGLYHDGGIDVGFTNSPPFLNWITTNAVVAPLYQKILDNCQIGNEHCPDGQYHCIMSASVNTQTSFSVCSEAYFNMFLGLASQMPTLYEDGCLPEKR